MPAIRVTIGDMPLLLRSLVEGILAGDPQFELSTITERGARTDGGSRHMDVLVISEAAIRRAFPAAVAFEERGKLGIVAISPDGHDAAVMRLNSHRARLGDSPRQSLSNAILEAVGLAPDPGG
jgi:hypothetical protein